MVGEDLHLCVDRYMNWGVSLLLLPKLHSSHFMGSLISLEMQLSFIRDLIDKQGERRFGNGERSFDVVEVPAADDYTVSTVPESDNVRENEVGMDEKSDDEYNKDSMCIYQDDKDSMCVCANEELSSEDDDDNSSEEDDNSKDLGYTIQFNDTIQFDDSDYENEESEEDDSSKDKYETQIN